MKTATRPFLVLLLGLPAALALAWSTPAAAETECASNGEYGFVCGPRSAEDLVQIPGTDWIIASGMIADAPIYLVDTGNKTWSELYPGEMPREAQDMEMYGACPCAPVPGTLVSHGLNIRAHADGGATLYVVGHGRREAIEVFDVDTSGATPVLTWRGCVLTYSNTNPARLLRGSRSEGVHGMERRPAVDAGRSHRDVAGHREFQQRHHRHYGGRRSLDRDLPRGQDRLPFAGGTGVTGA